MAQEPRPLNGLWWPQIEEYATEHWREPVELQLVLAELKYRSRPGALELRERVTDRLVDLSLESFLWPDTTVTPSMNPLDSDQEWPQIGLLKFVGYTVGQNGVAASARRQILDHIYRGSLPRVHSQDYMISWGYPGTGQRLQKLAESLAAFARNAKRKDDADMIKAINEWETDLEYLRVNFYVGRYDFDWPQTA